MRPNATGADSVATMILAAPGDTPYNVMLLLHILALIVGFSPAFVHPIRSRQMADSSDRSALLRFMAANSMRIYSSGIIVAGLIGFGIAGMSDEVYKMSQAWLAIAFVVWVAILGVMHAMVIPGEKAMANGDRAAESKATLGVTIITVLMIVELYLMIFKPGL